MLQATLGASLLENILADKGIVKAGYGNKKGRGIVSSGGFLNILLGTLGARLLANTLSGKGMNRAGKGLIRAGCRSSIKNKDFEYRLIL